MKYVYAALSWVFGLFFLLSGLFTFTQYPVTAMLFIVIALFIIPLSRSVTFKFTQKRITGLQRTLIVIVLFTVLLGVSYLESTGYFTNRPGASIVYQGCTQNQKAKPGQCECIRTYLESKLNNEEDKILAVMITRKSELKSMEGIAKVAVDIGVEQASVRDGLSDLPAHLKAAELTCSM